jgi:hypothetical protein
MTTADDTPNDTFWEALKDLLHGFAGLFGEPAALFALHAVPRRQGQLIRAWLAALEAIARGLLLMAAAALPASAVAPRHRPAGRAPIRRRPRPAAAVDDPSADDVSSERWAGVAFRALSSSGSGSRGTSREPRRFIATAPLALRFEALLRVAEAPEPFARRLARRLRAAPALASRLLRPPPPTDHRSVPGEEVKEVLAAAAPAAGAFQPDTFQVDSG